MTILPFPPARSHVMSANRPAAERALGLILNEHYRQVEGLLQADGAAVLLNERLAVSIEFMMVAQDDIYVRMRHARKNLLVARLGAMDEVTGLRATTISSWKRKPCHVLTETYWELRTIERPPPAKLLHPHFRSRGKVVALPSEVQLATGRSRATAAPILLRKLMKLMDSVGFPAAGDEADLYRAPLHLSFRNWADGVYFSVKHEDPSLWMTGYIDPVIPGRYAGGRFHAMTWKRGWEASLFNSGEWTVKRPSGR